MKKTLIVSSLVLGLVAAACASQPAEPAAAPEANPPAVAPEAAPPAAEPAPAAAEAAPAAAPAAAPRTIEVVLEAKSKSKLTGKATLTETEGGVHIVLNVEGIEPGDHGAHIHETGDCSSPDGKSAGGHFNPQTKDHGLPGAAAEPQKDAMLSPPFGQLHRRRLRFLGPGTRSREGASRQCTRSQSTRSQKPATRIHFKHERKTPAERNKRQAFS